MPLPEDNIEWPPKSVEGVNKLYKRWGAWYSGDTEALADVYQGALGVGPPDPKAYSDSGYGSAGAAGVTSGGILVPNTARAFWGNEPQRTAMRQARLHVPLASDIAATSAKQVFGEAPRLTAPTEAKAEGDKKPIQARMQEYLDEGAAAKLLEGAELCAAYGGVYMRVHVDDVVAETPIFSAIPPFRAVPVFRSGYLVAVTFWKEILDDNGVVWRHLERHEVKNKVGMIIHGLYKGTKDKLGTKVQLQDHPDTEGFAELIDDKDLGAIVTGAARLSVAYVPNLLPHRLMPGSPLGRSDYLGIEPVMDGFDEVWTSLLRDIRIGKGRLIVPDAYLTNHGPGNGASFDPEQEIFQTVTALPNSEGLSLTVAQFAIRVVEHMSTAEALMVAALRGAGYSPQTFGLAGEGTAATATEIAAREKATFATRGQKIGYWRPELRRLVWAALEVDVKKFGPDGVTPQRPDIEWPDAVAVDATTQAQTLQLLEAALAVSTKTKVSMLHPDWDGKQIDEEVELITVQHAPPVVDDPGSAAGAFGGTPSGKPGESKTPPKKAVPPKAPPAASGSPTAAQTGPAAKTAQGGIPRPGAKKTAGRAAGRQPVGAAA